MGLFDWIKNNQKIFYLYGIPIRHHSELKIMELAERAEIKHCRYEVYMPPSMLAKNSIGSNFCERIINSMN